MKDPNKGNQNIIIVKINEPQVLPNNPTSLVMSNINLNLEKAIKEKEDLEKEFEKV